MTFNTSLFVSLLLILLPNAKCVSVKRTAPKNNVDLLLVTNNKQPGQQQAIINTIDKVGGYFRRFWYYYKPETSTPKFNIDDEELVEMRKDSQINDVDYVEYDSEEEDINLKLFTNTTEEEDYHIHPEENMATEAPEMDRLAVLVDENGQVDEHDDDDDDEHHTKKNTTHVKSKTQTKTNTKIVEKTTINTTVMTTHISKIKTTFKTTVNSKQSTTVNPKQSTTVNPKQSTTVNPNPSTTIKSGVTLKPKSDDKNSTKNGTIASKFNPSSYLTSYLTKYQLDRIEAETKARLQLMNMCVNSTQDSGYWCDGLVGRLEIRYYYSKDSKSCECFLYYGCLGNKNNFHTIKECEDKCKVFGYTYRPIIENTCILTP